MCLELLLLGWVLVFYSCFLDRFRCFLGLYVLFLWIGCVNVWYSAYLLCFLLMCFLVIVLFLVVGFGGLEIVFPLLVYFVCVCLLINL